MSNFFTSKIVANSQDLAWSQAYSTINLYIVLSIEKAEENSENIVSLGKDTLEKLQREFFAVEEKKLEQIKEAVKNTVESIEDNNISCSIVLATIINNTLYIITAGKSSVVIKRGEKFGIVAEGEKENINSFSGFLKNNDIIIIQTEGFAKKIPVSKLPELFVGSDLAEVSENIAPVIHEEAQGTEAAIIIEYKHKEKETVPQEIQTEEDDTEMTENENVLPLKPKINVLGLLSFISPKKMTSILNNLKYPNMPKKTAMIIAVIIILVIVSSLGIFVGKKLQERSKHLKSLENVLNTAQSQFDEAVKLSTTDKNQALYNLDLTKENLKTNAIEFSDVNERKKIDDLLLAIDKKIGEVDPPKQVKDKKLVLEATSIKQISEIAFSDGELAAVDKIKGIITTMPSNDTAKVKNINTDVKNAYFMAKDKDYFYLASENSIFRISRSNQESQKIISLTDNENIVGMNTFLGNIYLLNISSKSVEKYQPSSFGKTSYLGEGIDLSSPVSMAIDGSLWIFQENGKIRKFTKGKEDNFEVKGLRMKISKNSTIYTDASYNNIYILDQDNKKIISISKNGEYQNYFDLKDYPQITSFCVDEKNNNIYVVYDNKIFSLKY